MSAEVYEKIKSFRTREDLKFSHPPNLQKSFTKRDGTETPVTLRPYQIQMVYNLVLMNRFVVGDDTGLGKTVETIAALCTIWKKFTDKKVLVVTKKSSVPQWESELTRFTTGVRIIVATGSPKNREAAHKAWEDETGPVVLIQGYTSIGNDFQRVMNWKNHILIFDEATAFKNPSSRTHKVCSHLSSQAERCWGLTATVLKNNLMEGYAIFRVIVPDLFQMAPNVFMTNYCIVQMQRVANNRKVPMIVGYRHEDLMRFKSEIDPFFFGRMKHVVAKDLPVLTTKDVRVGLSDFQEEKYLEAVEGLLLHGDGEEREVTKLTSLIYCQEIVNHPALIEFPDYSSEKMDALVDLLSDEGEFDGEKVIVFTRFKNMVNTAIPILKKHGIKCVRVTGDENEAQRKAAMDAFQDPKSDVTVIFITMAGGDAINLQAAKALIFYDTPWSAGDYIQILGRMIRVGSEHDRVYAVHLIARDTIDERVQEVFRKKMKLIETVLGERIKGEKGQDVIYESGSEVKELYSAMISDARRRKQSSKKVPI